MSPNVLELVIMLASIVLTPLATVALIVFVVRGKARSTAALERELAELDELEHRERDVDRPSD
jgi:hypothetical protein